MTFKSNRQQRTMLITEVNSAVAILNHTQPRTARVLSPSLLEQCRSIFVYPFASIYNIGNLFIESIKRIAHRSTVKRRTENNSQ